MGVPRFCPMTRPSLIATEPINRQKRLYIRRSGVERELCFIISGKKIDRESAMAEAAESAPAPPPAEPAAKKKKQQPKKAAGAAKSAKKPSSGPSVSEQIVTAVSASKERSGVSLAALKKTLAAGGYDVDKNNSRLKLALKALVTKETLLQVKGSGASGSFKLNKKQLQSKDKAAAKKKAPLAAAKAKKPAAAAKKAPKSPKKPKKVSAAAKSPKKLKKPAKAALAAKSPKKTKAAKPKKATKSPAKKTAVKPKAAAAKSPAKAKAAKAKVVKTKKAAPKKK